MRIIKRVFSFHTATLILVIALLVIVYTECLTKFRPIQEKVRFLNLDRLIMFYFLQKERDRGTILGLKLPRLIKTMPNNLCIHCYT